LASDGYAIEITRDRDGFYARVPDLPGCESYGGTLEETYASIEEAAQAWIETVLAAGGSVPLPRGADDYSGKFVVRVGASVHRDLVRLAALDGVSLNAFVASVLARETGRREVCG
jgi:antitoxin HicB